MSGFKRVNVSELIPGNRYYVYHPLYGLANNAIYVGKLGNKLEFSIVDPECHDNDLNFIISKSNLKICKEV